MEAEVRPALEARPNRLVGAVDAQHGDAEFLADHSPATGRHRITAIEDQVRQVNPPAAGLEGDEKRLHIGAIGADDVGTEAVDLLDAALDGLAIRRQADLRPCKLPHAREHPLDRLPRLDWRTTEQQRPTAERPARRTAVQRACTLMEGGRLDECEVIGIDRQRLSRAASRLQRHVALDRLGLRDKALRIALYLPP